MKSWKIPTMEISLIHPQTKKRIAKKVRKNISQLWLRPIVRGKVKSAVKVGAKL